nr:Ig-like domain-containing protein [Heyndrickxia oleronia]
MYQFYARISDDNDVEPYGEATRVTLDFNRYRYRAVFYNGVGSASSYWQQIVVSLTKSVVNQGQLGQPGADEYLIYNGNMSVSPNDWKAVPITKDMIPYSLTNNSITLYMFGNSAFMADYVELHREPINTAPTMPGAFTSPVSGTVLKGGQSITITHGTSTDAEGNAITYEVEASYNNGGFTNIRSAAGTSFAYTIPTDKTKTSVQFRVRAKDSAGAYSGYQTSSVYTIIHNSNPTLTLSSPTDNVTLYETDTLNIEGYASDADNGNIVNARYQLNGGTIRALATGISTGSNTIPFNKQLTFRGGKLYDGDTAVTDELAEGVAHQLKVWSEDDQGGKSAEQLRNFYVVPNRPPALTIDPFTTKSDLINADKVTISGTASDPDGNTVVVSYKLNKGLSTEVYRGKDGAWSFDLSLKDLVAGENTVAIEVVDSYNSKTSKTLKLNKNRVATPLLTSEVRYKIDPPSGTAKGVLLWVQRDVGLTVTADISMGLKNEQETYEAMTLTNTAPVSAGVVEDEFVFEASAEKDNIMLKLTLSRESADVNDAITLISGVLS